MITRQRQSGMSLLGMLIIAIMAGFYIVCGIRLSPHYFEYLTVRDILIKVADESQPGATSGQIRRHIGNLFNTNGIYAMKSTDVEIIRKDGKTILDGSYEARVPIIGRIDAVMRFDDLQFQVGRAAQ
jgi:hypothetical protein